MIRRTVARASTSGTSGTAAWNLLRDGPEHGIVETGDRRVLRGRDGVAGGHLVLSM